MTRIAALDVKLHTPRATPPNIERLRDALNQRAEQWKSELCAEPKVAAAAASARRTVDAVGRC